MTLSILNSFSKSQLHSILSVYKLMYIYITNNIAMPFNASIINMLLPLLLRMYLISLTTATLLFVCMLIIYANNNIAIQRF